jgi:Uma2 family endonuclease
MATLITDPASAGVSADWTAADMQEQLGGIPLKRILMQPSPGKATVEDVEKALARTGRAHELVDHILVEKPMGYLEARIAYILGHILETFLETHDLGMASGPDGPFRISGDLVRSPDVAFITWARLPGGEFPSRAVPEMVPDLAIEVLSETNTPREMERKLRDYFSAGTRLVWYIDPRTQTARAHTSPDRSQFIPTDGVLDGGEVLPGFEVRLADLFARAKRVPRKPE